MILEDDEPKLLNWIVVQLNNMNQSNASFIAKYIITLLRQNKSTTEDYKAYFIDELKSFLKARTISFVNNLFDVIADGKYKDSTEDDDEVDYNEDDADEHIDSRVRGRNSTSPSLRYRDDRSDDEDDADQRQSRSRTSRHREPSFDTMNRTSSNSSSISSSSGNHVHSSSSSSSGNHVHSSSGGGSSSSDKGVSRRDAYDSSNGRDSYDKKDYRLSSKPAGSFLERQQQRQQQRDTSCTTYPLHPMGSSMGYRPQSSADYLEVNNNNNNYQTNNNNNNYQTNNNNNNYQANSNNSNNMHIVNSTGAMAQPIHQAYLPMPSSSDYTMNTHMNMYSGYTQMPAVSTPSYANAYQQAVSAALSNPYANGGLPLSYYGAAMTNMGASNMSLLSGTSGDDPNASSIGLHTGGSAPDVSSIDLQTSPSRVSYEEELMAQHSMSSAAAVAAAAGGPSKPPPPSGPAPSTAISPMQQTLGGDTSGGFVYGSSINYSSQYTSIASAVSFPMPNANIISSNNSNNADNNNNNNNNSNRPFPYKERKGGKQQYQQQLLPEHERCTLKCSGVPHYVTEQDIRTHFEAFGFVVELQIVSPTPSPEDSSSSTSSSVAVVDGNKKKVYNECLVQFYSAANAKKCFTSPLPVLNNRFIHLHVSTFNITPVTDVPTPSPDIIDRDAKLLNESILLLIGSSSSNTTGSMAMDRKKPYSTVHTQGVSNKYRRLSDEHSSSSSVVSIPFAMKADTNDSNAMSSSGDQKEGNPAVVTVEDAGVDPVTEASNGPSSAVVKSVLSPSSGVVALTKEKLELKEKHEQLKALRQQAEDILKKKEGVLQQQLDKCREMIDKLESSGDSDSKQVLLQSLESKVLTFQTQLRTVREQIEKGVDSQGDAFAAHAHAHVPAHSYAAPYHMGTGFGRQQSLGGRRGRGGSSIGPGRIIYGGRRGARMSNSVYIRSEAATPSVMIAPTAVATTSDPPHIANGSAISDPEPPHHHHHNHLEGEIVGVHSF